MKTFTTTGTIQVDINGSVSIWNSPRKKFISLSRSNTEIGEQIQKIRSALSASFPYCEINIITSPKATNIATSTEGNIITDSGACWEAHRIATSFK